jgi:hypothetical protein
LDEAPMKSAIGSYDIVVRRLNALYDYVLDWEYDRLDDVGRAICRRFDRLSLIVVVGDMKILPWDFCSTQLITLLWMAEMSKKPTLCCGGGTFAAMYAAAGQGSKFHVVNTPHGDSLEKLANFQRYAKFGGQFPGVWLENETGDLYCYGTQYQAWMPVCNIGMNRLAMRGFPSSTKYRQPAKHYATENHTLRAIVVPEPMGDTEYIAHVRSKLSNHFALRNTKGASFVCSVVPDWCINLEGGLPCNGLAVLADSERGPIILVRNLSLYIAAIVGIEKSHAALRLIVKTYIEHIVSTVAGQTDGNLGDSIFAFLFGPNGTGGGQYDSIKHRKIYAPPLSQAHIRTLIINGPKRIDTPVVSMFLVPAPTEEVKVKTAGGDGPKIQSKLEFSMVTDMYSPRERGGTSQSESHDGDGGGGIGGNGNLLLPPSSPPPRQPPIPAVSVREPHKNRKKRLAKFLSSVGHKSMLRLNIAAAKEAERLDPYKLDTGIADSARDMFSGLRMDTSSVYSRRSPTKQSPRDSYGSPQGNEFKLITNEKNKAMDEMSDHDEDIFMDKMEQTIHIQSKRSSIRPKSANDTTNRPMLTKRGSSIEGSMSSLHLPIQRPQTAGKKSCTVEYIKRAPSKPFNNKEKYDHLEEQDKTRSVSEYQSMFKGGYLSSFEKEKKEYMESKKQFVGGDFLRHFGHASRLPLRQPGHIRPHGKYPDKIPPNMELTPDDWHYLRSDIIDGNGKPWLPTSNVRLPSFAL